MSNYLNHLENPWNLVGPPAWFRSALAAFDRSLVMFPSAEMAVYRVARRCDDEGIAPLLNPAGERSHGVFRPDQRVYVAYKLIPVTSLLPFIHWSPLVIQELAERCLARFGGADAAADRLDDFDAREEKRLRQETHDGADAISHHGWSDLKWRTGQRVDVSIGSKSAGARSATPRRKQPVYRPLNFSGGSSTFAGVPARTTGLGKRPAFSDGDITLPTMTRSRSSIILTP